MAKQRREDHNEVRQIEDSLKVSSYKDAILDAIINKRKVQTNVPQYGGGPNAMSLSNESSSLYSLDTDSMAAVAMGAMGGTRVDGILASLHDSNLMKYAAEVDSGQSSPSIPAGPQHTISGRQYRAIQRYPALIEFLGTEDAEPIVREILAKINQILVQKIGENSKSINKFAQACVAEKQNIKQFFVGENKGWVCCVIASGPFRGDEAIYFNKEADQSMVLRPVGKKYEDVSESFNIVHEYAEGEVETQ